MGTLLQLIAGFFAGDAGTKIGNTVANATAWAGLVAAFAPVALWLHGNKDAQFIVITYGDIVFWCGLFGAFVFAVVKVAHYTRSPGQ